MHVLLACACSTGWLSHWGEVMANTSASFVLKTLNDILTYANNTGSVNFYMAHGGSNFGYWAGARPPGHFCPVLSCAMAAKLLPCSTVCRVHACALSLMSCKHTAHVGKGPSI